MSKAKKKSITESQAEHHSPAEPVSPVAWSTPVRLIVTLFILLYLAILLIGPMSNPVASVHLTAPLARATAPVHRALFLGHGYRFFAPDPGPNHRVVYKGRRADGSSFEGHFPNRDENWPRLLYHRWFMLSETLFNENLARRTPEQFEAFKREINVEIARYRGAGQTDLSRQLQLELDVATEDYHAINQRIELLASRIAKQLLDRNDGQSIELFVQERELPFPEDVNSGTRLDNEQFLSPLFKVGTLDQAGFQLAAPESLPTTEDKK